MTPDDPAYLRLDREDPLARFRDAFVIDDPDSIYLDGNSLGRLPKRARARIHDAVDREWGQRLIRSWGEGWLDAPQRIGDRIGELVGAAPGQVVVADSTSVNLFKLAMAALEQQLPRSTIVTDETNFPSDLYVLHGVGKLQGSKARVHVVPPANDGIRPDVEGILAAIDETTALVTLSHVTFKGGYLFDAGEITARAHASGALVLWDLSHSVGSVPMHLDAWGVDLAVGCTYKYLNGGPGAPAFAYVRRGVQERLANPIQGWFGRAAPFAFELDYAPAPGIDRFLVGTPPVLSLLGIEEGVAILQEAGMAAVRRKSEAQTEYLIELADANLASLGFTIGTPREAERRGAHVTLQHPDAYRISRAMLDAKVIPDFREPDNIRFGISPLYTTFEEIHRAVMRVRELVTKGAHEAYGADRAAVT